MQLHLPPADSLRLCNLVLLSDYFPRKDPSRRHSWGKGRAAFSLRLFNELFSCSPERPLPAHPSSWRAGVAVAGWRQGLVPWSWFCLERQTLGRPSQAARPVLNGESKAPCSPGRAQGRRRTHGAQMASDPAQGTLAWVACPRLKWESEIWSQANQGVGGPEEKISTTKALKIVLYPSECASCRRLKRNGSG